MWNKTNKALQTCGPYQFTYSYFYFYFILFYFFYFFGDNGWGHGSYGWWETTFKNDILRQYVRWE
jgi:hypothetical protein